MKKRKKEKKKPRKPKMLALFHIWKCEIREEPLNFSGFLTFLEKKIMKENVPPLDQKNGNLSLAT